MEAAFESLRAAASTLAEHSDVGAASTQGSLALLELKQRNRELYEGLEAARTRTAAAKAGLETTLLQLENLEYEKAHYLKEIRTCREFTSEFSDQEIGLVDLDEFLRRAPPELTAAPEDPQLAGHQRMLSRLHLELAERQALAQSLREMKVRKKALQDIVTSRRTLVLAMATELKAVKAACAPLAAMLGTAGDRSLSVLLPPPLKCVFAAFDSVGAKKVAVTVLGTPDSTRERCVRARPRSQKPAPPPDCAVHLFCRDAADTADARRSTRREGDDEDETVRRQADGESRVHPLSVGLDVLAPETGARLLALRFEWSPIHGVSARVDHGPADVLAQPGREAGEAGEGPEDGVSDDTAAATPPWLAQLAADGRPDTALATSVVETLRAAAMR